MRYINFQKTKFLLIGEIHGIHENLAVLKIFVTSYFAANKKFIIAFEWPSFLSTEINEYLSTKKKLYWKKWDFINDNDGRISKEHIQFLSWLKNKNLNLPENKRVSVRCFDENTKKWNGRDKMMAQNLQKIETDVIVVIGNLHARKEKFELDKEKYIPVGFRLPRKKVTAIKINYLTGKFYNHGIKNIQRTKSVGLGLMENNGADFDYVYTIKNAHPIKLLKI